MNDVKMKQIIKRRKALSGETNIVKDYTDRQNRLKLLVDTHGIEAVAAASNLSVNTVRQYCRTRMPSTIAERPVIEAETILEGL